MTRADRIGRIGVALAAAMLWSACASTPNPTLERTREKYEAAQADPATSRYASVELYEAEKAVDRLADAVEDDRDDEVVAHLAYLADQRIAMARIAAETAVARERVKELSERRDALRLQARTAEVEVARGVAAAEAARAAAEAAKVEQARRDAEQAMERAKQLERELKDLEARRTAEGLQLTMRGVLFAFDSAELQPGARSSLERIAEFLNEYPDRAVSVDGHTDSVGSDSYNQDLSERRARATADYLASQGVDRSRIRIQGHGESKPVAPNTNEAGRQKNRRVEILLRDPQQG